MYYLRTRAAADAIKFTVDTTLLKENGVHVLSLNPSYVLSRSFPKNLLKPDSPRKALAYAGG